MIIVRIYFRLLFLKKAFLLNQGRKDLYTDKVKINKTKILMIKKAKAFVSLTTLFFRSITNRYTQILEKIVKKYSLIHKD